MYFQSEVDVVTLCVKVSEAGRSVMQALDDSKKGAHDKEGVTPSLRAQALLGQQIYDPMEASHWVMEALRKNYRGMKPADASACVKAIEWWGSNGNVRLQRPEVAEWGCFALAHIADKHGAGVVEVQKAKAEAAQTMEKGGTSVGNSTKDMVVTGPEAVVIVGGLGAIIKVLQQHASNPGCLNAALSALRWLMAKGGAWERSEICRDPGITGFMARGVPDPQGRRPTETEEQMKRNFKALRQWMERCKPSARHSPAQVESKSPGGNLNQQGILEETGDSSHDRMVMLMSHHGTAISAAIGSNDIKAAATALYWGCLKSELDDIRIGEDAHRKDEGFIAGDARVAVELLQRWPGEASITSAACTAISNIVRNHGRPGAVACAQVGVVEVLGAALKQHRDDERVQRNSLVALKLIAIKSGDHGDFFNGSDGRQYVNAEKAKVATVLSTVHEVQAYWVENEEICKHAQELVMAVEENTVTTAK